MPFTIFHLGPALGLGIPLKRFIHVPTFLIASVILDVEPILVIVFRLNYPLHGFLHTFIGASAVGVLLGCLMYSLRELLTPIYAFFMLQGDYGLKAHVFTGVLGCLMHVLLDAPLYDDITPFYPVLANPLYNPYLWFDVYWLSLILGLLGFILYLGSILYRVSMTKR